MMYNNICLQTLINRFPDLSDSEIERYFNYAAIWAFAGKLFSQWWRQTFQAFIEFPEDGTVCIGKAG
jgi:dynein heavy chain